MTYFLHLLNFLIDENQLKFFSDIFIQKAPFSFNFELFKIQICNQLRFLQLLNLFFDVLYRYMKINCFIQIFFISVQKCSKILHFLQILNFYVNIRKSAIFCLELEIFIEKYIKRLHFLQTVILCRNMKSTINLRLLNFIYRLFT